MNSPSDFDQAEGGGTPLFSLDELASFWATVEIPVPGREEPLRLEVEYEHLSREEAQDYFEWVREANPKEVDALLKLVRNWRGVQQEFNPGMLERMLGKLPASGAALLEGFQRELFKARAKN